MTLCTRLRGLLPSAHGLVCAINTIPRVRSPIVHSGSILKLVLPLVLSLAVATGAVAQGTINFNCSIRGVETVGPGTYPFAGSGILRLERGVLQYTILIPSLRHYPAEAHFHADATSMIVSLAPYVYVPPTANWPGGITYEGAMNASQSLPELLAGSWYIQLHSPAYENGVARGYIVPVPEPRGSVLMAFALLCGAAGRRWLRAIS